MQLEPDCRPGGQTLCRYDTIVGMRAQAGLAAAFCCFCVALAAQTTDDPVAVFTEHPRLFLRPQRIRLLKRERERASPRWQQFETLVAGNAPMPQPGFAWALYYQVSGNAEFGKKAVEWSLTPAADLRQQALVFDWCQDLLTDAQRRDLSARLSKGIDAAADTAIPAVRARTLAAIALYDHAPKTPQAALERIVKQWWDHQMLPALKAGKPVVARRPGRAHSRRRRPGCPASTEAPRTVAERGCGWRCRPGAADHPRDAAARMTTRAVRHLRS